MKDSQIQKLQEVNKRLSNTIEDYETKEQHRFSQLKEEHMKLQVDFEKIYHELESKEQDQQIRLQECYSELEKVRAF